MKPRSPTEQFFPLDIVGSTVFGRYPKISIEQTFNQIISDGWLVPYAGHKKRISISNNGQGRGIYGSTKFNHLILVVDNLVYIVNDSLVATEVAQIDTFEGDVFIDENNASQIAICDKENIYIYNYIANTFGKATIDGTTKLDFLPGYICFQDGYFISVDLKSSQWRLSDPNNGLLWPSAPENIGGFQTKPDIPVACLRFPGKGNLLLIFGSTVTEPWYDVGYQLFPYQKSTFYNVDYGCLNAATIAAGDEIVVWLGANEKSGPVIMFSTGGTPQQISNDGINFKLAQLTNPKNSYGFLFKQDGHLIYQITFLDDNLTYAFDFNTKRFFTLTDHNMNYHIAKRVVYFNDSYYFVSFNDGNLYELNSKYTTYDGNEIPRIRVCKSKRLPDSSTFVVNNVTFTLEQGESADLQCIDMSISKDGGESFSSYVRKDLNPLGQRQNRLNWWNLGLANDLVTQFRFYGTERFVSNNGLVSYYQ